MKLILSNPFRDGDAEEFVLTDTDVPELSSSGSSRAPVISYLAIGMRVGKDDEPESSNDS